ncbi:hypothetical protein BE61_56520 [Bradyrhizobium elkanii USDA 61]|nr:hypothetical protein BE61_56520 [Bradyrhizobium elkanii USDA 61]
MDEEHKQLAEMIGIHSMSLVTLARTLGSGRTLSPATAQTLIRAIGNTFKYGDAQSFFRREAARVRRDVPVSARKRAPRGQPSR